MYIGTGFPAGDTFGSSGGSLPSNASDERTNPKSRTNRIVGKGVAIDEFRFGTGVETVEIGTVEGQFYGENW